MKDFNTKEHLDDLKRDQYYKLLEELKNSEYCEMFVNAEFMMDTYTSNELIYKDTVNKVKMSFLKTGLYVEYNNGFIRVPLKIIWSKLMQSIVKVDPDARGIVAFMNVAIIKAMDKIS